MFGSSSWQANKELKSYEITLTNMRKRDGSAINAATKIHSKNALKD